MENVSVGTIYAVLLIGVACASIAGFYIGRKKEATDTGVRQGSISSDITYIKQSMDDMKTTVEKLDKKLDENRKDTEKDIRDLLLNVADLTANYKSLHKRVDGLDSVIKKTGGII